MSVDVGESFYVRLDSGNVKSKELWSENSPTVFRNLLANPLNLKPRAGYRWHVALADIIMPNSFYNIDKNMLDIKYEIGIKEGSYLGAYFGVPITIPEGYYDPLSFARVITGAVIRHKFEFYQEIRNHRSALWGLITRNKQDIDPAKEKDFAEPVKFKMEYVPLTKRFSVTVNENIHERLVIGNHRLKSMLGHGGHGEDTLTINKTGELSLPANLNRFYDKLFVSCDIVKYSMIGNEMMPILRIIPLDQLLNDTYSSLTVYKGAVPQISHHTFNPNFAHLQYYPVSEEIVKSITILLSNEDGKEYIFDPETTDSTFVTLHFVCMKNKF